MAKREAGKTKGNDRKQKGDPAMGYYKRTFKSLERKGYFSGPADRHRKRFFLTELGGKLLAEATTPDEKTALYYSFIKVYRDAPEQDPLNRLAAFVMGHAILGNPAFAYGSWPSCFDPENPFLAILLSGEAGLPELLSSLSGKPFPAGLDDIPQLFSSLEKASLDGSYSPLYKAERELVYGWIQYAAKGASLKWK
jgi:hypothetical protein